MRRDPLPRWALAAALLTACGGGGGGGGTAPAVPATGSGAPSAPASGTSSTAAFTITIPSAASNSSAKVRRPAFVSSGIQSVVVFAASGSAALPPTPTTLVNVGPGAPGCTSVAAGTTCTINVPATLGPMTFVVRTCAGPLGTGAVLSTATFTSTIVANQPPIPLTLDGVVASVALSLRSNSIAANSGSAILDVNASDASGATIVGAGDYSVPINVTTTDPKVTLSSSKVTAPNQPITVTASQPTIVQFSATAGALSANAFTPAILTVGTTYSLVFVGAAGQSAIAVFPSTASFPMRPVSILSVPSGYYQTFAANASGTLGVSDGSHLYTFAPGATTPSVTLSPALNYVIANGIDAAGNDYVIGYNGVANQILVYPPGATSFSSYTRFINQPAAGLTHPSAMTVDAAGNIYEAELGPPGRINVFTPAQNGNVAPARTFVLPGGLQPAFNGLAVDPAGDLAVLAYQSSGPNQVFVFPPGASTPARTWSPTGGLAYALAFGADGTLYAGAAAAVGVISPTSNGYLRSFGPIGGSGNFDPISVGGSGAPVVASVTTVSGDFLAPSANKTWNYNITGSGSTPGTVSVYVDPQKDASGNLALVAFLAPPGTPDAAAAGGMLAGAGGFSQQAAGYYALSFGSVSNNTFALVPGGPLLVPTSLTLGQTWVPYPGTTATVTAVGTVPGISVCPNAPAAGATVTYAAGGGSFSVSYAPGCGITDLASGAFSDIRLTSITQNSQLGQQAVARRVLSANYGDTLRAIWKHVFPPWVKP